MSPDLKELIGKVEYEFILDYFINDTQKNEDSMCTIITDAFVLLRLTYS